MEALDIALIDPYAGSVAFERVVPWVVLAVRMASQVEVATVVAAEYLPAFGSSLALAAVELELEPMHEAPDLVLREVPTDVLEVLQRQELDIAGDVHPAVLESRPG